MDDKNNENEFDDVDFEEFDDEFGDDEDLLAEDDLDSETADFAAEEDEFGVADDDLGQDDWGDEDLDSENEPPAKSKKGSSSKLLLPVLALVAVAGAGGFYYTQIMNAPQSGADSGLDAYEQAQNDMNEPQPEMDIAIPMPSPITEPVEDDFNQQPDELSLADIEEQFPATPQDSAPSLAEPAQAEPDNGVLTPMPNIASLDENTNQQQQPIDVDVPEIAPMDDEIAPMDNMDLSAPTEMPPIEDTQNAEITAPVDDMPEITAPPSGNAELMDPMNSIEEPLAPAPQPMAEPINEQAIAEAETQNQELSSRITDLEASTQQKEEQISSLSSEIEALRKQLSDKNAELQQSEARIAALEKAVEEEKAASTANAKAPEQAAAALAPQPKTAQSTPQPASKPKAKPAAETNPSPQWELRSAQPGKAYVAIKNSENVLVVETGDTLQGIGKIQSIAVENSLWVVRGTQGKIVQ